MQQDNGFPGSLFGFKGSFSKVLQDKGETKVGSMKRKHTQLSFYTNKCLVFCDKGSRPWKVLQAGVKFPSSSLFL